jgi:hypothetical protein
VASRTLAASKPLGSVRRLPSVSVRTGARSKTWPITLRQPSCTTRAAAPISASEYRAMFSCTKSTKRASFCNRAKSCKAASGVASFRVTVSFFTTGSGAFTGSGTGAAAGAA